MSCCLPQLSLSFAFFFAKSLVLGSFKFTSLFDATTVNGRSIVYTKDDFGKDFQCGNPASVILCLF